MSDESYVIDLCDEVLGMRANRGHRFSFLRGDPDRRGVCRCLPVDAFYPVLDLVIEYNERQHTEPVRFFDRRIVSNGMTRGEQRRLYDARRAEVLPSHGIRLLVLSYTDFAHTRSRRLCRTATDRNVVETKLAPFREQR
jgi:hypothetical protein